MWNYNSTDTLCHYGVLGMKWGRRKPREVISTRSIRGHAGPGKYLTKKRQVVGDKRDLDYLNNGGHLSVGLTKKRQEKLDARDKALIEKRLNKSAERSLGKRFEEPEGI